MTSLSLTALSPDRTEHSLRPSGSHLAVQIVGTFFFGIFAIVATVLAFDAFWLAGVAVALVLALRGFGPLFERGTARRAASDAKATAPQMPSGVTGNANFDAYRADVLKRLEDERVTFVSFLDRLRDAKDKTEFDGFMSDRAIANASAPVVTPTAQGIDTQRSGAY